MLRDGMRRYLRNLWNFIDFSRNFLYVLCFVFRGAGFIQQREQVAADPQSAFVPREQWSEFDPQLVADGLFAAANILRQGQQPVQALSATLRKARSGNVLIVPAALSSWSICSPSTPTWGRCRYP